MDTNTLNIQECANNMLLGDENAKKYIIAHYNKFIIQYIKQNYNSQIYNIDTLIQYGLNGLMKYIDLYTNENKYEFSKHATRFIVREINIQINEEENKDRAKIQRWANNMLLGDKNAKKNIIDHYKKQIEVSAEKKCKDTTLDKDKLIEAGMNGLLYVLEFYKTHDINISKYIHAYIKNAFRKEICRQENRNKVQTQKWTNEMLNLNLNTEIRNKARQNIINYYMNYVIKTAEKQSENCIKPNKEALIKVGKETLLKSVDSYKTSNKSMVNYLYTNINYAISKELKRQNDIELQKKAKLMLTGDNKEKQIIINYFINYINELIENNYNDTKYNKEELYQSAILGLLEALNSYNNIDVEFSKYVSCYINKEIKKSIKNDFTLNNDCIGLYNNYNHQNFIDPIIDNENKELHINILKIIKKLIQKNKISQRDAEILYLRFYKELTLTKIGSKYKMSKQRTDQIIKRNLKLIKKEFEVSNSSIKQ